MSSVPSICAFCDINNYVSNIMYTSTPTIYAFPFSFPLSCICPFSLLYFLSSHPSTPKPPLFHHYTILYINFAIKKHANPNTISPPVKHQNQVRFPSYSCPGTQTFIPHRPVMMFIGSTMVPRTVSFPRTSAVCSWRSFILMLIWAR